GCIAISTDSGATFTVKTGPSGDSVKRVIVSRFNTSEIHVLTASAWYASFDGGDTWQTVRQAAPGQVFNDLLLSHTRNVICSDVSAGGNSPLERAEDGDDVFTFPSLSPAVTNIVAVAAHIREDRFYCVDD